MGLDMAAQLTFSGSAFLSPEPAQLLALARELGDAGFIEALESNQSALEPEYNRLFLNPAGTPCPPWQGAHDHESHLMGESHLGALKWYRRYGAEPNASNEPADHIGLLLLFYANLLRSGVPENDTASFKADHLAWVPKFCELMEAEARHRFYRLLASMTREALTS